jgi:predicted Zn-ribbon and HTH transcriptional regulator
MTHKLFECNACGYVIFVPEGARDPDWCPQCRSVMSRASDHDGPAGDDHACDECGYAFRTPLGAQPPYKCASCNRTFPSEPNKRVGHKL